MSSHSLPAPTWILDYLRFDLLIGLQLLFLLVWVVLVSSIVSARWTSLALPVGSEMEEKHAYYIIIIIIAFGFTIKFSRDMASKKGTVPEKFGLTVRGR